MTNHLAGESSRYLQQHAGNPVDWYPWSGAALEKARGEDKPIFLSIGYSACHWCHVMAHESFEDEETAAFLNAHFVSIKVDREERPDLDRIYMGAVQALTGGGGWPMSVFITPDGEPFYGGTYFPKEPRYQMPSFMQVLSAIADAWSHRRAELVEGGQKLVATLQQQSRSNEGPSEGLDPDTIEDAYQVVRQGFDRVNGGWGSAPKFPQPMVLEFLLRYHHTTGDDEALAMVVETLEAMARGGIYDQIGGGFHRYAVDAHWVTPHFEKMLYDNAQLARVYLHAYQVMRDRGRRVRGPEGESERLAALFRGVVEETLDYVMREMTSPEGGFYATQDADTEGEEGKFYVWTPDEIRDALGGPATRFLELYGVTDGGNFEGKTILTFNGMVEEREAIAGARRMLYEAREGRTRPGRDEKVLTSWNGLMLAAFAEAAWVLDRDDCRVIAERNADFLLRELRDADGRLWHTWKDGKATVSGFLEDYTHLIEGLLALYQTTFEPRWYTAAAALAETMVAHFGADVGFYDTPDDAEALVVRPRELQDNAVPSGNAMAVTVLLKLAGFTHDERSVDLAHAAMAQIQDTAAQYPMGFGQWLQGLSYALSGPREIAIVGEPDAADTQALLAVARDGYRPFQVMALGGPGAGAGVALLHDRGPVRGRAAAYVCRKATCQAAVTDAGTLRGLLKMP